MKKTYTAPVLTRHGKLDEITHGTVKAVQGDSSGTMGDSSSTAR